MNEHKVTVAELFFWLPVLLVAHSYVFYPILLGLISRDKQPSKSNQEQPTVVILMAVYNGAYIIEKKIRSVFHSTYPAQNIKFYIGTDACSDETDQIVGNLLKEFPQLHHVSYSSRMGKIKIINALFNEASEQPDFENSIIISTDATAVFEHNCIAELVKNFDNPNIGVVGANILKGEIRQDGISGQEKAYYERELKMKYEEGVLWGCSMGVFGACFAARTNAFSRVPENFLADDFYISMHALEKGFSVLLDRNAHVYMNVPNSSAIEFKRKIRIATGNFQNLLRFKSMLFAGNGIGFSYWSHKVIRWLGPLFILIPIVASYKLRSEHFIYELALYAQLFCLITPLLNYTLEKINLHLSLLKFVAHFYLMNLGIAVGFIKFIKGVKTSVWEPTKRIT